MSEADLHQRHDSSRLTLEHFQYTADLQETIAMLNMSTGFKEYTIDRTKNQTGLVNDFPLIGELQQNMAIPPVRVSPCERKVAALSAVGATAKETAAAMGISEAAVKAHKAAITQKAFQPNFTSSLIKLMLHDILGKEDLTGSKDENEES